MSLASEIKAEIKANDERKTNRLLETVREEEKSKGNILRILKEGGIMEVNSNGYLFSFKHNGKSIKFVNQPGRLTGDMVNTMLSDEERWVLKNKHKVRDLPIYEQAKVARLWEKIGYREFMFSGNVKDTVMKVIKIVNE